MVAASYPMALNQPELRLTAKIVEVGVPWKMSPLSNKTTCCAVCLKDFMRAALCDMPLVRHSVYHLPEMGCGCARRSYEVWSARSPRR